MTEEERNEEQPADVEGHGTKHVVAAGLAGAALIGAGAGAVKLATDDDKPRNQGALVSDQSTDERLAKADADQDGYVTYQDLEAVGFKLSSKWLEADGIDVTPEALAAAGYKVELELVQKDTGFPIEGDTIMLKLGASAQLDELAKGDAAEWAKKHDELDSDDDGYAGYEELDALGYKAYIKGELEEASYKEIPLRELEAASIKLHLADLGEGGFAMEKDAIFLKAGIDQAVDAFLKESKS